MHIALISGEVFFAHVWIKNVNIQTRLLIAIYIWYICIQYAMPN